MNIQNYRERDEMELVEMKPLGNGMVMVYIKQFDPTTGKELPTDFGQFTVKDGEAQIAQAEKNLADAQASVEDLKAFWAAVKTADDEFAANAEKGAEILGKSKAKGKSE